MAPSALAAGTPVDTIVAAFCRPAKIVVRRRHQRGRLLMARADRAEARFGAGRESFVDRLSRNAVDMGDAEARSVRATRRCPLTGSWRNRASSSARWFGPSRASRSSSVSLRAPPAGTSEAVGHGNDEKGLPAWRMPDIQALPHAGNAARARVARSYATPSSPRTRRPASSSEMLSTSPMIRSSVDSFGLYAGRWPLWRQVARPSVP